MRKLLSLIVALVAIGAFAHDRWPAGPATPPDITTAGSPLDAGAGPTIKDVDTGTCPSGWFIDTNRSGTRQADEPCVKGNEYTDATNCTSLSAGAAGDVCYEKDANAVYVCDPTAGGCDTAAEWRRVGGEYDRPYVDIRDFGAKCDGLTDDTAAIAAAITASRTAADMRVRIPASTGGCLASQIVIKTGTWLEGESGGVDHHSLLIPSDPNTDFIVDDPGLAPAAYLHGIVIKDLMIYGQGTGSGTGSAIHFSNARGGELTKFENLLIEQFGGTGILMAGGCEPCYFENVHPFANGANGIWIHRGGADRNSMVYMNHISGDGNIDSLIRITTSGGAGYRESYLINGVKSECAAGVQPYAVSLDMGGSPIAINGLSHGGAACDAGSAAIQIVSSMPRLTWTAVDIYGAGVTNWMTDTSTGVYTIPYAQDTSWGISGTLGLSSHTFPWTASPKACNSYTKGATYYDTSTNQLKTCIDDGTPAYEVTSPAAVSGTGVLADATHVWLKPGDDFQTACTALNSAIDAANTDGWMYVYGGTHTVGTDPLTCSGVSSTERMHVVCIGGPVGKNPTGDGSGCKILPAGTAGAHPTVETGWASWDGFYVLADDDAQDSAMKATASVTVTNSAMANPDSSNNPAQKNVLMVSAPGATNTAQIENNYFYMYCSDADTECNRESNMVVVDLSKTGNKTNNALVQGNTFEFAGTSKSSASAKAAAFSAISGDIITTQNNTYHTLLGDGAAPANHPYAYYFANISNVYQWTHTNEWFRGAGQFEAANPYGTQAFFYQSGGSGMKDLTSAFEMFPNNVESAVLQTNHRGETLPDFQIARDGDVAYWPIADDTKGCYTKQESSTSDNGTSRWGIDESCTSMGGKPTFHFARFSAAGTTNRCGPGAGYNAGGADATGLEGDTYFDTTEHTLCVCSFVGGEWAFRRVDGAGNCSTPVTTTTTTTVAPTTTTTTTLP